MDNNRKYSLDRQSELQNPVSAATDFCDVQNGSAQSPCSFHLRLLCHRRSCGQMLHGRRYRLLHFLQKSSIIFTVGELREWIVKRVYLKRARISHTFATLGHGSSSFFIVGDYCISFSPGCHDVGIGVSGSILCFCQFLGLEFVCKERCVRRIRAFFWDRVLLWLLLSFPMFALNFKLWIAKVFFAPDNYIYT